MRLQIAADGLELTAITQDVGNATEELDATYDGHRADRRVQPGLPRRRRRGVAADEVTLSTLDALKPAVVRGVGRDDYLYLLMPVRVP